MQSEERNERVGDPCRRQTPVGTLTEESVFELKVNCSLEIDGGCKANEGAATFDRRLR